MSAFRADSLSIPKSWADAIVRWRKPAFQLVKARVDENLSGRMMNRVSGQTQADVDRHSGEETFGFKVGTRKRSLIAWMLGVARRGYTVVPRRAKVLRWQGKDGQVHFARKVTIPPWTFKPVRPVIHEAFESKMDDVTKLFAKEAKAAMLEMFPPITITMDLGKL